MRNTTTKLLVTYAIIMTGIALAFFAYWAKPIVQPRPPVTIVQAEKDYRCVTLTIECPMLDARSSEDLRAAYNGLHYESHLWLEVTTSDGKPVKVQRVGMKDRHGETVYPPQMAVWNAVGNNGNRYLRCRVTLEAVDDTSLLNATFRPTEQAIKDLRLVGVVDATRRPF